MENDYEKIKKCFVCDNKEYVKLFFQKNNFKFYKCKKCGHIFIDFLSCDVSSLYSRDYFLGSEKGFGYVDYDIDKEPMRSVFRYYIKKIEKFSVKKGNLLDVGAATGFFIDIAGKLGWKAEGLEVSSYAAGIAREKGLNISQGELKDCDFKNKSFDVITLWDVLEHLPEPDSDMRIISKILKPNGILAINTPDAGSFYACILGQRWHLFVPPEHINYFTKKSIILFLEKNGFCVEEMIKIGKIFTLEYIFHIIAKWTGLSFFKKIADFLKNHSRVGRISFSINLRDNMFIIARKKS